MQNRLQEHFGEPDSILDTLVVGLSQKTQEYMKVASKCGKHGASSIGLEIRDGLQELMNYCSLIDDDLRIESTMNELGAVFGSDIEHDMQLPISDEDANVLLAELAMLQMP